MTTRYRKIKTPDQIDGCMYRATHPQTGEIIECNDLMGILKFIARALDYPDDAVRVLPTDVEHVNGWAVTDEWRIKRLVRRAT